MENRIPRNGALSGMIITAIAAAAIFPLAFFDESANARFTTPIGAQTASVFLLSACVMAAHKLESFLTREYRHCPVYLTQSRAWGDDPARAIFLSFVPTFVGMLLIVALAITGPPWHLAIITVWLAHGLHELHHMAKSLARRRVYPGLLTSLVFVGVQSGLLFPLWHDLVVGERGSFFTGYYLALPLVLLAYYVEDRRWIARAPRSVWDPHPMADPTMMSIARTHRRTVRGPLEHGGR